MMNNTASKYQTLVRILDEIRAEAPSEMTSYHPLETDSDNLDKARAKAFIHLYLKVKYGLLDFAEREKWVTESTNDGGIDAYYIDRDKKVIYFVQSKFRGSDSNFCSKEIELREILAMDIDRVTAGETAYENGAEYSGKIKGLQRKINEIENIGQYTYVVVILANLTKITPAQLRRLLGGFPVEVFDFNRCYDELVFPVVSGTYYSSADLFININLTNREVSASRISYPVFTEAHECEITVMFVPTIEIAKIMRKYKNSILRFNPRSYLDLSKNTVNQEIAISITDRKSNEFALFNNGITMLSDETNINERVGKKGEGQLHVKNPQIINGGQTAYTLSRVYEDALENGEPEATFFSKEVMLKVITFTSLETTSNESVLRLIEAISKATNQQTAVEDADRHSNDEIQVELQQGIFREFGFFYERKRGEYIDGLKNKYIDASRVIDRESLLRVGYAISGLASEARREAATDLFSGDLYLKVLKENSCADLFFGFVCFKELDEIQKKFRRAPNNKFGVVNYGNAIRYGKMAVLTIAHSLLRETITPDKVYSLAEDCVNTALSDWLNFEAYVRDQKHNRSYFRTVKDPSTGQEIFEADFPGYYKGKTVNEDLRKYFRF